MRRRKLILSCAIVLVMLSVFLFLFLPRGGAKVGLSFVPNQQGHWGIFYAEDFSIMRVTNNAASSMSFDAPTVQWEQRGKIISDLAVLWEGKQGTMYLPAKTVGSLPFAIPKDAERFRVSFGYRWSAGPVQMTMSQLFRNRAIVSGKMGPWLLKNGMVDGRYHRVFESPWMSTTNSPR